MWQVGDSNACVHVVKLTSELSWVGASIKELDDIVT
jgi:hypothetical protein